MSADWKGDLRNTGIDVFIDTTLLVLSICAYIPQVSRLRKNTSTRGISPYYILFNILFSNAQFSQLLLCAAYAWPTAAHSVIEQLNDGSLKGLRAFGAILGLLQIFVQWCCSITVLLSFVAGEQIDGVSGRTVSIAAFLHAAVVLFPAVTAALPKPSGHSWNNDILLALVIMSNQVVAPCFVLLQFVAQYWEMRVQKGDPGALSLLSLGLQVPTMMALGYRWLLRLGNPTWGHAPAPAWLWYQWAFPSVNYVVHAVGCALLLACYLFSARRTTEHGGSEDRMPLLG